MLRIFRSGKLIYKEKPDPRVPVHGGSAFVFAGTLYDSQGKASHRVNVGLGRVLTVQKIGSRRIVRLKKKGQLPVAIGVFADHHELIQLRNEVLQVNHRDALMRVQKVVEPLWLDK